ncbi:MAG: hypothetical protein FJ267_09635, partial [Planctomycetes bacterium]|nr:hypothetical protein [Planctomycetota bacterium]
YADVIAELDDSIGQILDKINQLGLDDRTLVLFTSDNGPWFGGSSGGLRGMKATTWEGGYRVPLIARWPNRIPKGRVDRSAAIMMDLFATILSATGVTSLADRTIDGKDLLPCWTSNASSPHDVIFGQVGETLATARDTRWKLHLIAPKDSTPRSGVTPWIDPRGPDGVTILAPFEQHNPTHHPGVTTGDTPVPLMLFDLENDPAEQHNVANSHPEIVERLQNAAKLLRE